MELLKKIFFILIAALPASLAAQEYVMPLLQNRDLNMHHRGSLGTSGRPTVLSLPFFEDFTDSDVYPALDKWSDRYVYVNNTMGVNPISRGVATFDALNEKGIPYDTITPYSLILADSLTSQLIDMSTSAPSDSVYLSFLFQPQGNGFAPKPADSLMLYLLKSNGVWEQVWSLGGDTLHPFKQVMIPVTDTGYFNSGFRMRWINKATKGISDSHWNLDYIRLDKNRNFRDTAIRDIAFSQQPNPILNDFSAMPYRHFRTNPSAFLAANQITKIKNNNNSGQSFTVGYTAKVLVPSTPLGTGTISVPLTPYAMQTVQFPMYNTAGFGGSDGGHYIFEHKYYCTSVYPGESKVNDTIVHLQEFKNYFAYDDGSAERAYFLNLLPGAPGTTLVEYALFAPDTLRGVAIRFARQVPGATQKEFALVVYRDIAVNGGTDVLLYKEEFLFPKYEDSLNGLSVYEFEKPQYLNAGTFYVGVVQPAGGVSDSLYIALDANRVGVNHRYYKVENTWLPSQLDGALLLRPLVGSSLPVGIPLVAEKESMWHLSPNPSRDKVNIAAPKSWQAVSYTICDLQGKIVIQGNLKGNGDIDIRSLLPGVYFVRLSGGVNVTNSLKLLKL